MMKQRLLLALTAALLISGVFTFWLSRSFARSAHGKTSRYQYVALNHAMNAGDLIASDDLQTIGWNGSTAVAGAITRASDAVGKSLLYPLAAGEPILDHHLMASGAGLSAHIPDGMRAISLKSDDVMGVAGYLLPGTHVDVLMTLRPTAGVGDVSTSTVLQNAQVLTAGQKMQPDPDGRATHVDVVTLLVSPEDAERVVLASSQGALHFVLRNGADRKLQTLADLKLSSLVPTAQASAPVEKEKIPPAKQRRDSSSSVSSPSRFNVVVVRGDKQSVESF